MKKKNYLVVGGGGFIGGHLIKKLIIQGHSVMAVDIKPYFLHQGMNKTYDWIENIYKEKKNDEYIRFTKSSLVV